MSAARKTQAEYLDGLQRSGWHGAVTTRERERLGAALAEHFEARTNPFTRETTPARKRVAVVELQTALAPISFDREGACIELASLVERFRDGADGRFAITSVVESHDESGHRVSFDHSGRTFSWTTESDDWTDDGLLVCLNEALAATASPVRFLPLPELDQWIHVTLVPPDVFEAARGEGLFVDPDV